MERTRDLEDGFTDVEQAALYDRLSPPRERNDFRFYLPMVLAARAVLDVGCGTGALLHLARDAGHAGRLVGLDPATGMLEQARKRPDIEWILGDLSTAAFDREFDLAVMTGHAFQELLTDAEVRTAFAAIRSAHRGRPLRVRDPQPTGARVGALDARARHGLHRTRRATRTAGRPTWSCP